MNESDTLIERTVSNLKDLVDSDTVIGKSIVTSENGMVIPVSKVTVGIVSGSGSGGERPRKLGSSGSGGGAGGSISPIGFLVLNGGTVKFVNISKEEDNKWLNFVNSAMDILKPSR